MEPNDEPYAREAAILVNKYIEHGLLSDELQTIVTTHLDNDKPIEALRTIRKHR